MTRELWDLKRGDADDDRSSPYGRGWESLAVSAALEVNYLTAAIAFTWLVLIPAVVVGLAVPVLMVLARSKLGLVEQAGSGSVAAMIALAVLAVLALWAARPLVAMTLDNSWHLHYTLVFPLFVILREAISAGLERLSRVDLDVRQLHRRRRAGTIVATILLVGVGLVLASGVPFSALAGLDEPGNVSPTALAYAALGNGIVVLGVSTIAASLFWFGREIAAATPVAEWAPGTPSPGASRVRLAHLSDLHVVGERYGFRMESGTRGPCGNSRVSEAFSRLSVMRTSAPLERIFMTGDITDSGTRAEWVEFLRLIERSPDLRGRLLVVPGNHDVNVIDRTNPGRFDLPWSVSGALRKLRSILALDAVQGQVVHVVDHRSGTPGPTLEEYLRTGDRAIRLRSLAEAGTWRGRREAIRVWEDIFPLVVPPSADSCGVILLDSNARRHFSLTNGIGVIGRRQLRTLDRVLRSSRGAGWIVAMHHHVAEYPVRGLGLKERAGVALVNAPDVLRVIARHDRPVLLLHGHRHRDWIGTRGHTIVCSAPSVTLGDKGSADRNGRFLVYDVAFGGDGRLQLTGVERVAVL